MKPIIGITGNQLVKGINAFYGHRVAYTQQRYIDVIQKVGGLPIILPIGDTSAATAAVDLLDGLLMTGGQDISPYFYDEEPLPEMGVYYPPRDAFELSLVDAALKRNKPILAICRGMQLVNVAFGGSLYQDGSKVAAPLVQHQQHADEQLGSHKITIKKDSLLETIHHPGKFVNSLHHQFINRLGKNLQVVARTADQMIEAIEFKHRKNFFLGVQWHPELMYKMDPESEALFQLFIDHAKKNKLK
ncbi:gamma-glutamyl-gamma-aminobutyrate hydrolase family protein [Listeria sp. PSOL-1]|uniref:gamma-glutamyl-gamma-aminobutyrate hydrolase family protein n=1 Tax=Listeria sp. PSOL-1 TaxID=1844999 RepID=UPI0013CF6816|nr:gamma-glutamyl-gamma-aminobutyrate hydrolase family protein [Listeria sp. PSOL-1]